MSQVGLVFTVAWYLVNRGSKYWQEDWENQVCLLDGEVTGPILKHRAKKKTVGKEVWLRISRIYPAGRVS